MITDPRSRLTGTKSSRKGPSFQAEMPMIKLIGAAIKSAVARDSSKISAFAPQEHQIRMRSDERDNDNNIFYFIYIALKLYTYSKAIIKTGKH